MEQDTKPMRPPLEGVRVLDLSTMLAGPFGSMMLGDLGAEVIKVETLTGDNTRNFPPHFHKGESLYYMSFNRNKKSVTIDLKKEEGRQVFYELVRRSDVVWDNYRDGITKKLKVDYKTLREINPAIICCSITAYGENNPYDHNDPTYDLCIQAMSGVLDMTGERDRPPVKLGVPMADLSGGWFGVVGVLAALLSRGVTGRGQKVDISMLDGLSALNCYEAAYLLNTGSVPQRLGTQHRSLVPYQIFRTKDLYIAIVVASDKFWKNLCQALGCPELIDCPEYRDLEGRFQNREKLVEWLESVLTQRTCGEWLDILKAGGVPCAPVNTLETALREPALLHRGMVVSMDHEGDPVKVLGNPVKLSENPPRYQCPPRLGQDTAEVLGRLLNYSEERIRRLAEEKTVV